MIRRTCLWVAAHVALLLTELGRLTVVAPKLPRLIQFSLHPFVKRGHGKVLAGGGRSGGFALRLTVAVAVLAFLVVGATVVSDFMHTGSGATLAGAMMLIPGAAGRFGDASSDLLTEIDGLSTTDIQYVVDNTNPFDRLAPGGLLGDALFPARPTQELDFKYLKGAGGAAVMAHVTTHNSEAPLVNRRGLETVSGQIPAIKQKRYQDAHTLIRLQSADALIQSQVVRDIYDDVTDTRLGVVARLEKLRMDALATGTVSQLTEEGLVYSVDYGVPNDHKETLSGGDLWSATTAEPLSDLERWQNIMVGDTGHQMAVGVTSSAAISALRQHESVRKAIWGVNYDRRVTNDELNQFLTAQGLPTLISYDQMVAQQAANGTQSAVRLFPENRLTLIPAVATGSLGRTLRAPTAEEAVRSIADGVIVVDQFRIATHVYVATQDPKGLVTLSVASTFPSFERAGHVFQAVVLA